MKCVSLFSGAGIGETFLKECGINIVVANEIMQKRVQLYKAFYPETEVVCGDIKNVDIFREIIKKAGNHIDLLLASPPCQGLSVAGKNRHKESMTRDQRNYLFIYVIKVIKLLKPTYVLIENVPSLLKLSIFYKDELLTVNEILIKEFGHKYTIEHKILDSADYGVPQTRLRAIIKMYKKNKIWLWPEKNKKKISVREAIGHLPTLESGQTSLIKWHYARNHDEKHVLWLKNTQTGKSAFSNRIYFPKKKDGSRIKGYESCYRRIKWDEPCPTITIRNDAISSQRNVHPGRLKKDGTYSDARVLSLLELFILSSLPPDWDPPNNTPELLIRQSIGESIPPLMIKKIIEGIV
jgi:DNA (cytosine-5)-methyltransferase 1